MAISDFLSFLFKVECIEDKTSDPQTAGSRPYWEPSTDRQNFHTTQKSGWYLRAQGGKIVPYEGKLDNLQYSACSLFYRNLPTSFLATRYDCREGDTEDSTIHWEDLTFEYNKEHLLSILDFGKGHHVLAGRGSSGWVPQLVPLAYEHQEFIQTPYTHLAGNLALIIGLAAFSSSSAKNTEKLNDVLQTSFYPPTWNLHQVHTRRLDRHGVVVKIGLDPYRSDPEKSRELLKNIERGVYGPLIESPELSDPENKNHAYRMLELSGVM
ncbi:hypothetical protein FQN57_007270 [Myotisia sp. PD_48]|nr:hypothetical protein FQN57_007270 [Myotisia sp. PD_48]